MAQQNQVPTISHTVYESTHDDNKKKRESVQIRTHKQPRPKSLSQSAAPSIILQPSIPEVEEDGNDVRISIGNGRTSFTKKPASRSNSQTSLTKIKKNYEVKSYENGAYDDRGQIQQFDRGHNDSTRSSTHESVISLQVQREQYCCCARWTLFERRLAISVGVLGALILGLALAVGFLAGNNGVDEKFIWKP